MIATALFFLAAVRPAVAGHEILTRLRLRSCASTACVAVEAAESRRSPLDAAYVFKQARVTVVARGTDESPKSREFIATGGYYDPKLDYLVWHGRPGGLFNLATGKLTVLESVGHSGPLRGHADLAIQKPRVARQ